MTITNKQDLITHKGVISSAFNAMFASPGIVNEGIIDKKINKVSDEFNLNGNLSPFKNSGVMIKGKYYSVKTLPLKTKKFPMSEILIKEKVDKAFYIDEEKEVKYESHPQIDRDDIEVFNVLDKWNYLKGRKMRRG